MFPYNDEENAWMSGHIATKNPALKQSLIFDLFFALITAILLTTIPSVIYFFRTNLF